MRVEIRFVTTAESKYTKTIASYIRDCRDLAEALQWAGRCLEMTTPDVSTRVTAVRLRTISPSYTPTNLVGVGE